MKKSKEQLLAEAKKYLGKIIVIIKDTKKELDESIKNRKDKKRFIPDRDRFIEAEVLKYNQKRSEELGKLEKSPYFFKCKVKFDGNKEVEDVFISKFNFSEQKIYSWFSPVSQLRFENIGNFSYAKPDGTIRKGELIKKDQFMITDSRIVYMATEAEGSPRQLVYQEHLSNRKKGFILPEVIEKMEKAQDEVIRADHRGSYLISGPAGSGKTTLALHRVAYLAQSPDTSEMFPGSNIIVFVQDEATLEYFRSIFPQLGIENIIITTFYKWALDVLEIDQDEYVYVYRYGKDAREKDEYEYEKNNLLKNFDPKKKVINLKNLSRFYSDNLEEKYFKIFHNHFSEKKLDRFDLMFLLMSKLKSEGELTRKTKVIVEKRNGTYTSEIRALPIKYSLIIVDEVQNYTKEEIIILKTCINENNAILYTGDLAQQTKLCTIRSWDLVGEKFAQGRRIVLDKVYRNTREILEYIRSRGYDVFIPEGLKRGERVVEKSFDNKENEISYVSELIEKNKEFMLGILHTDHEYLLDYKERFGNMPNVHILTISEAQGVEFDITILVGHEISKKIDYNNEELKQEKERVVKDLDYVAMTRAMSALYVCLKN